MSMFADWFYREFLAIRKEFKMVSQAFADAIARIKAERSSHADDAKTIGDLNAANAALQGQVDDLTQKLNDATSQIADMEQQAIDAAPAA